MRSPAPTPEPELEPVPGPQQTDRFQTRSGRHRGLVSAGMNEYEDELDDYLGRSARLARTPSDIIVESGITPHDLIACSAMTSPMTSFMTSFGSISRDIRKTFSLGIHSTCLSPLSRSKPATMPTVDRAHYVRDRGHTARPSCSTCIALVHPCITLPISDARKLHKCVQCTLSKQKCSIDRTLNKDEFEKQTLTPCQDVTEDISSESGAMSINTSNDSIDLSVNHQITSSAAVDVLDKAIRSAQKHLHELETVRSALIASTLSCNDSNEYESDSNGSDNSTLIGVVQSRGTDRSYLLSSLHASLSEPSNTPTRG